ncbi:MAG: GNAT family N-acetyltransferase [Xanthomonadales bacterium]|nr:GNAT family N-acetyltransferase [Xanthomonadales bacterium]
MTRNVSVREAVEDDAADLLALRHVLLGETEYMLWGPGEFDGSVQDERQQIRQLNACPNARCLVATDDNALVGFLHAMGSPVVRLRHATTLALGVRRSHWGHGAGSALLAEALAWSRSAGLVRVELTVHTTNVRAVALYLRHGFEIEGTRRKSLQIGDRYVDEYLMCRTNDF